MIFCTNFAEFYQISWTYIRFSGIDRNLEDLHGIYGKCLDFIGIHWTIGSNRCLRDLCCCTYPNIYGESYVGHTYEFWAGDMIYNTQSNWSFICVTHRLFVGLNLFAIQLTQKICHVFKQFFYLRIFFKRH